MKTLGKCMGGYPPFPPLVFNLKSLKLPVLRTPVIRAAHSSGTVVQPLIGTTSSSTTAGGFQSLGKVTNLAMAC